MPHPPGTSAGLLLVQGGSSPTQGGLLLPGAQRCGLHRTWPQSWVDLGLRARAAGNWPQSHRWGTGWAGNPALPGWLSERAETRQLVTRGSPGLSPGPEVIESGSRDPAAARGPTPVWRCTALATPSRRPRSTWEALQRPGSRELTFPCPRRPRWPPSVLPIPGFGARGQHAPQDPQDLP